MSVPCSSPGCPNTVSGKGLFCPIHFPTPGDIDKFSVVTDRMRDYGSQLWTPELSVGVPSAGRPAPLIWIAIVIAFAAVCGIVGWIIMKFL
jgi:hypothetical protein